jgi:ribosomal-protein-alanine N-acetyltransferase
MKERGLSAEVAAEMARPMAAIHAEAFAGPHDSPWSAAAISALLQQPGVFSVRGEDGFILMRGVAGEAEILTLAVRPAARRAGLGAGLVRMGLEGAVELGATRVFLEVAEDNVAARALYASAGFVEAGRRPGYYAGTDGSRRDALLLVLNLPGVLP